MAKGINTGTAEAQKCGSGGNGDCLYYKQRNTFHRHHFLWVIVIATIAVAGIFAFLIHCYIRQQHAIVDMHDKYCTDIQNTISNAAIVRDSCYFIDDLVLLEVKESQRNIAQQLELQFNKLQSDFTVLSLWAGILMIVFLVFSIYSVFKVDELMKQSRDALQHADETAGSVDKKMRELDTRLEQEEKQAIDKLNAKTDIEFEKIKAEIEKTFLNFKNVTEVKANEFDVKYQNYLNEMKETNKINQNLLKSLIDAVKSSDSDTKESKNE